MNDNERLDKILDEALSEYREAEPLAGLEDRVLQRLRLQPRERRIPWWKWAAVAACAGLVVAMLWIGIGGNRLRNSPANQAATRQHEVPNPGTTPAAKKTNANQQHTPEEIVSRDIGTPGKRTLAAHRSPSDHVARVETASIKRPRAAQFPSPAPLTAEEHALLALASSNPDALLNQPDHSRDLEIAPIAINPLAGSDAPAQENSNE
jgi:hypothetical protein